MTPEDYRLPVAEYLSGRLSAEEAVLFEKAIASDARLRTEIEELRAIWEALGHLPQVEPSPAMRAQFYQKLNAFRRGNAEQAEKHNWWNLALPKQLAAGAALFAVGLFVGRVSLDSRVHSDEIAQMRSQVQGLQEMVALSLLERQSATSRLEGVEWSSRVERPNDELRNALVLALNHDPNVNVRLSSIDALERFTHDAAISQALVNSIRRQDSPLVQVALIDALVRARNHGAADEFRKLTADSDVNATVRQRAQWGLEKLTYQ